MCSERGAKLFATDMRFCIDNGAMIAQVQPYTYQVPPHVCPMMFSRVRVSLCLSILSSFLVPCLIEGKLLLSTGGALGVTSFS